ncbi:MAG TPA: transposase [Ktedonobacteraceae bacterium]|jgi:predicted transposase|nr:transposase [Ktedonobacteraceae bacterium]
MKQVITAKLKLHATSEQFAALRATQLAYRDALNYVSRYAFEHSKMSNQRRLQDGTYDDIRVLYGLPAQMACNVPRQVGATDIGLWTKVRTNAQARRAGITRKRYKGLDQAPQYVSPTLTYNHQRDYSFKHEQQVSILTLSGRVIVAYSGYGKHVALIEQGARIGAARLWYDQARKRFYLLVSLEIELPEPTFERYKQLVGVDVGIRYLAVTSTATGDPCFFSGKQVSQRANHYARLRKRLQQKGTRGSKRTIRRIEQRERRLKRQANHHIARQIVTTHQEALIGLEDLTGIRERTKPRKRKRKKGSKGTEPATPKMRRANRVRSQWSFAELHALIAYKAVLAGSLAIKVEAQYTSQACPTCGYTHEDNRPNKGLVFHCGNCHYELHADLVGARNLVMRTLFLRQAWGKTGQLSVAPDTSDSEAKAERLRRYSELRWS